MIKLLIVDDSALVRRVLGQIFTAEGDFEIQFARNGEEALDLALRFEPDVVTLDIQMPVMDGLACLDQLMLVRPCPVVVLSSLSEKGAAITLEALSLGAVDFIAKPGGALSLDIDRLAPLLVEKIRMAAEAKVRGTLRLKERVRRQSQGIRDKQTSSNGSMPASRPRRVEGTAPATSPPEMVEASGAKLWGAATSSGSSFEGLVLIGSSTGGPPALDAVLSRLPSNFPWPVLVAQHMPATFTASLARRLDRLSALCVTEVTSPTPLLAGHVYIGRGEADLIVNRRPGGVIALPAPSHADYRWHPSVDRLVDSAMRLIPPNRLIGVLMTGMGNDGASAMTELKMRGGRTIAEAQETAIVWGMPGELVKAGGAVIVAPVGEIADQLMRLVIS